MFEGSEGYVCSSLEIYMIQEANEDFFLGKYSHTMVPFFYMHQVPVCGKPSRGIDVNNPGLLSRAFCLAGDTGDKENRRPTGNKYEDAYVPTLYFIGGDPGYLEGEDLGPQLTMFRSEANILCELDGIMCPSRTGDAAVYSTVEDGPTGWPDKDRSGSRFGVPRRRQTCNFELARGIKFADEVPECAPDGGDGDFAHIPHDPLARGGGVRLCRRGARVRAASLLRRSPACCCCYCCGCGCCRPPNLPACSTGRLG